MIPVSLGSESLQAYWDTGSPPSAIIDPTFATKHPELFAPDSNANGEPDVTYDVNNLPVGTKYSILKSMKIGDFLMENLPVEISDLSGYQDPFTGQGVQVILGFSVIRQYSWFFDFKGQRWGIYPAGNSGAFK